MLRDDDMESENDEEESPSKGRENEVTVKSLIREKSSPNKEKSSNELSKGSARLCRIVNQA